MKFLLDHEIDLNQKDLLSTKPYSETLKEVILNSPVASFTVGLFGEWGSGKSSIINTVIKEVKEQKDLKIDFVVYDAWKYSNDSFRRMFLLRMKEVLRCKQTEKFELFYENKSSDLSIKKRLDWRYIGLCTLPFFIGLLLIPMVNGNDGKITLTLILSLIGVLLTALSKAVNDYKVSVVKPQLFAPEQFEECFKEMVSAALKKDSLLTKAFKWIDPQMGVSGLQKLVVVIDNIDRCHRDVAYDLISNVKNFLGYSENLIFLIPVDDGALIRHIQKESSQNEKEAEEFLRKIFNVTIRIKPFSRFDLYDFTNGINLSEKLLLNPTTIDIISKEYASNPRRIIQFFNNLITELRFFEVKYGSEFIAEQESLICKLLIIREEWPQFYKFLAYNPSNIKTVDNVDAQKIITENPSLNSFLIVTDSVSKDVKFDIFEKLLSVSDRTSKIPAEIFEAIQKKEIEFILNRVQNGDAKLESIVDVLIERLNIGVKRRTFETEVNNVFEVICRLNVKTAFTRNTNLRIENEIKNSLSLFIPHVVAIKVVTQYSKSLLPSKIDYLDTYLEQFISNGFSQAVENRPDSLNRIFEAYIETTVDPRQLEKMSSFFLNKYQQNDESVRTYELSKDQLQVLAAEDFFDHLLDKMEEVQDTDYYFQEIIALSEEIAFSQFIFTKIINKINGIYPNFNSKKKDWMINFINALNEVFVHQQKIFEGKPNGLFHTLIKHIFNRTFTVGTAERFLPSELAGESEIDSFVSFAANIYKICDGGDSITNELQNVYDKSDYGRNSVVDILMKLKDEGYDLLSVAEIFLNENNPNKLSLALVEYALTDDRIISALPQTILETIIGTLIKGCVEGENQNIPNLLILIAKHSLISGIINQLVSQLSKEEILMLKPEIQKHAFDIVLDGDNIYDYEQNLEFLKAIAVEGTSKHLSKLSMVIINKLTKEETLEEAIDIIENIKRITKIEAGRMLAILENVEDEEMRKRGKSALEKFNKMK